MSRSSARAMRWLRALGLPRVGCGHAALCLPILCLLLLCTLPAVARATQTSETAESTKASGSDTAEEQSSDQDASAADAKPKRSKKDERVAKVGMRARIDQIVLPGSELEPARATSKSPLMVRIVRTWPHGKHVRYDLEWYGFVPGTYDLTEHLVRKDGSPKSDLPELKVEVVSSLPAGVTEPSDLDPRETESLGGYSTLQIVVGILWVLGLLAILFVGRKRKQDAEPEAAAPTLADRLRPLVLEVAGGEASEARKAELERLLVAFWRSRLGLREAKAGDAIQQIRRHPDAGALLRQVEGWLHMPDPPKDFDIAALLEPYRHVTAESFEPDAAPGNEHAEAS